MEEIMFWSFGSSQRKEKMPKEFICPPSMAIGHPSNSSHENLAGKYVATLMSRSPPEAMRAPMRDEALPPYLS
jgi:hypothetical protein